VDGEQVGALGSGGNAGGAVEEGVAFDAAGERDDDPFPGCVDVMVGAVGAELIATLAASQSRASSRRAVRLPARK
jgi:hypothetical protein